MQNLISFLEYAIKFNVSSTKKVLLQFQKRHSKTHKQWISSKKCIEQKIFKIKFPIRNVISNLMYLQPISVNQAGGNFEFWGYIQKMTRDATCLFLFFQILWSYEQILKISCLYYDMQCHVLYRDQYGILQGRFPSKLLIRLLLFFLSIV